MGPWGNCSTMCGVGVHERKVQCLQQVSDMETIEIPTHRCNQATRPPATGVCREECTARWKTSVWLEVCGPMGGDHIILSCDCHVTQPTEWDGSVGVPVVACTLLHCVVAVPLPPQCDGMCGENLGTQSRIVLCYTREGRVTNDSECDRKAKPISTQPCTRNCSLVAMWKYSNWSQVGSGWVKLCVPCV